MGFTVGLTGGVASGKTLVEGLFRELGIQVLDADLVARKVVTPPSPALAAIAAQFGPQFLAPDGTLDRRRMRAHVFEHPHERKKLEAILHPLMFREILLWRETRHPPYSVLSAAILFESGMHKLVSRTLVIDVPLEMQQQRLRLRDGLDEHLSAKMLAAQLPREERLALADDCVDNSGTIEATRRQVAALHQLYVGFSSPPAPAYGVSKA